ncbi:hypothetical protein LX36DRAFT_585246 [Colletotrichum falcatum]|nr:hypothetical protein LX36DRAFT_585246 [Colletotrichum falcatum]
MQFTNIHFVLLPVLATAQTPSSIPPPLPVSNDSQCYFALFNCPKGPDGYGRCLVLNNQALCVTVCPSDSTCPTQCKSQGQPYGYCTDGDFPCICSQNAPGP